MLKKYFILGIFLLCYWYPFKTAMALSFDRTSKSYTALLEKAKWYEALDEPDSTLFFLNAALALTTNLDSIADLQIMMGNQYNSKKDYTLAFRSVAVVDSLIQLGRVTGNVIKLRRDHLLGKIYVKQNEFSLALGIFNNALSGLKQINESEAVIVVRIYNYKGIAFIYLGDLESAIQQFQFARALCIEYNIFGIDLADVLQNIAIVYANQGRFDSAYAYINRSKTLKEELFSSDDQRMKSFYSNFAYTMLLFGETEISLDYYQKVEALLERRPTKDRAFYATLLVNIGNTYLLRNDFEKAGLYYRNAYNIFKNELSPGDPKLILAASNLAFVYLQTGDYDKALELLLHIRGIDKTSVTEGRILRNLAKAYGGLKNNKEAETFLREYVQYSKESLGEYNVEYAIAHIEYAEFLRNNKRFTEALDHFSVGQTIYTSLFGENDLDLADVLRKMAVCYYNIDQSELARKYFDQAEKILNANLLKISAELNMGELLSVRFMDFYLGKANYLMFLHERDGSLSTLQEAFQYYQKAIERVDGLSIALSDESRLSFNENLRVYYQKAVESAYLLYQITKDEHYAHAAFGFSAKGKAVLLMSSLRKNQAYAAGIPEELATLERKLNQEIQSSRKLVSEEQKRIPVNTAKISFLELRQFALVRKYDSLVARLETNYPDYYALKYNPTVSKIADVQANMKSDEVMIEYMLDDSAVNIFAITKSRYVLKRISNASDLLHRLITFRTSITGIFNNYTADDLKTFVYQSNYLYNILLQPVENEIENKRIVVIPDGLLGYLPFELLIASNNIDDLTDTVSGYAELPYLFLKHPISYAYSSGMRLAQHQQNSLKKKNMLAVVPEYPPVDPAKLADGSYQDILQPLPFALSESKRIAKIWHGDVLSGNAATKENFLSKARNYNVLHLAMHTIIDDMNPLYSRMIFQEQAANEKKLLETYELYSLQLKADLVVLSSCNTGTGQLQLGEGIISLSRGFLFAGVPSIVMTGWEVHDKSGSELTELFYNYLKQGYSKDVALQKAKIDYLSTSNMLKSHPFFWASYMVVGNTAPVNFHAKYNLWKYTLVGFLLLLVLLLGVKKTALLSKKTNQSVSLNLLKEA